MESGKDSAGTGAKANKRKPSLQKEIESYERSVVFARQIDSVLPPQARCCVECARGWVGALLRDGRISLAEASLVLDRPDFFEMHEGHFVPRMPQVIMDEIEDLLANHPDCDPGADESDRPDEEHESFSTLIAQIGQNMTVLTQRRVAELLNQYVEDRPDISITSTDEALAVLPVMVAANHISAADARWMEKIIPALVVENGSLKAPERKPSEEDLAERAAYLAERGHKIN